MARDEVSWLAQRTYRVRSRGNENSRTVVVGLGPPRKLSIDEQPFASVVNSYGCVVQTGAEFTRRLVSGRDSIEALFHALLSIEQFLVSASKDSILTDESGAIFDPANDGLLNGPICKEYLRELKLT